MMSALSRLWIGGCLLGCLGIAQAEDSAITWLNRMVKASQMLNYEGTFIYLHDKQLETMSIVHQYDGVMERERLVSLNGEAREIIKQGDAVTCIWPNSKSVIVDHGIKKAFPAVLPLDLSVLMSIYRFSLVREERVVERLAQVVRIQPKDLYRYGYHLWLDKLTALPLKSARLNHQGEPIEQIMYTSLKVVDHIDRDKLTSKMMGRAFSWTVNNYNTEADMAKTAWKVVKLPSGFVLSRATMEQVAHSDELVEHLVYSDGLASISVYIEKQAGGASLAGASQMGALTAYGMSKQGYFITVVGEVPKVTTQLIAESMVKQ